MGGNGTECTAAETSPVNVDGKFNHIVCRNPFPFCILDEAGGYMVNQTNDRGLSGSSEDRED